jgi:heptosyltransferase-2
MLEYFVYLIYRAGFGLIGLLPLRAAFALGNALGFFAWLVLGEYRRLGFHNIDIAFGEEKSPREMRRLVRRHFQRLGANLLSSLKLAAMPLEKARANVRIENAEAADRELRSGRPVVFILSHIGNWELQAQMFPSAIGYVRNSTIYQPLKNRYIDKHVRALRGRAGVQLFDRNEGFQKAIELLRGGGAIGILSDQHAGDQGLWVPFFGKLASTTSLPALLAKRTGAAVLGTAIYTESPGRWRMSFTDRIDAPGDSVEALTAKANDLIATQTRRAPEDGFWLHNRWKTPRPNFLLARYKRGVYLPKHLPPQQLKPFRILIRSSNWLGDAVMSVPAVRDQKRPTGRARYYPRPKKNCADVEIDLRSRRDLVSAEQIAFQRSTPDQATRALRCRDLVSQFIARATRGLASSEKSRLSRTRSRLVIKSNRSRAASAGAARASRDPFPANRGRLRRRCRSCA